MKSLIAGAVLAAVTFSAGAQELGRGLLGTQSEGPGLGRAPLAAETYDGSISGGSWGVKLGLGRASANWDLGSASGSATAFSPQVSVFYKVTDTLDFNLSTFVLSADDTDAQLGDTEADMTRIAVGARYWMSTETRITPYLAGGIGYYILDGDTEKTIENGVAVSAEVSVEDAPGAFIEAGAAFQVSDTFFMNAELSYDRLLDTADATINGQSDSFDVSSLSFNLGGTWLF